MKKLPARPILLVAVAIVLGMGIVFIIRPETVLALIFGIAPSDAMQGAGRIGGAATLSLGIAGWPASQHREAELFSKPSSTSPRAATR